MEHRIFLCYSPILVKYARFSLGSSILDFHWVFPGLDSTSGVLLLNVIISVFAGFAII